MDKVGNLLVSVIIACHNAEKFIGPCMESLIRQTYQNMEILICDDASCDGTREKLKEWQKKDSRIHVFYSKKRRYAAGARNICIKKSRGDFLMVQDIDDISMPNRAETLVRCLQDNPNVDFASSSMKAFVDNPWMTYGKALGHRKQFPSKYDFLWGLPFNHPATMFRKGCILAVKGYQLRKDTKRGEDYDMFMRLYAEGYRGMNLPMPLYLYRQDRENVMRRDIQTRIDEVGIRIRGYQRLGISVLGIPFLLKPIAGYFVQAIKYRRL